MKNYINFVKELYKRGAISKQTYEEAIKKGTLKK